MKDLTLEEVNQRIDDFKSRLRDGESLSEEDKEELEALILEKSRLTLEMEFDPVDDCTICECKFEIFCANCDAFLQLPARKAYIFSGDCLVCGSDLLEGGWQHFCPSGELSFEKTFNTEE